MPQIPIRRTLSAKEVDERARLAVLDALRSLLEEKHLYQRLDVDVTHLENEIGPGVSLLETLFAPTGVTRIPSEESLRIKREAMERENLLTALRSVVDAEWDLTVENAKASRTAALTANPSFQLPTIKVKCENKGCAAVRPPHNSGYAGLPMNPAALVVTPMREGAKITQVFELPYQCQACRGEPLIFLVRREGRKLQMVGRSHMALPQVADFLPAQESKFFSQALVAFNTGNVLPGLFMLRTFVEQYLRRVLDRRDRVRGDELASEYSKRLHSSFSAETSLRTVYEELSEKLHAAKEDAEQFRKSAGEIERHFDLLRMFPLPEAEPMPPQPQA